MVNLAEQAVRFVVIDRRITHSIDPWDGQSFNMGALCGPWGDGSPGPESVSPEEFHEAALAMEFAMLEA